MNLDENKKIWGRITQDKMIPKNNLINQDKDPIRKRATVALVDIIQIFLLYGKIHHTSWPDVLHEKCLYLHEGNGKKTQIVIHEKLFGSEAT